MIRIGLLCHILVIPVHIVFSFQFALLSGLLLTRFPSKKTLFLSTISPSFGGKWLVFRVPVILVYNPQFSRSGSHHKSIKNCKYKRRSVLFVFNETPYLTCAEDYKIKVTWHYPPATKRIIVSPPIYHNDGAGCNCEHYGIHRMHVCSSLNLLVDKVNQRRVPHIV